MLKNQLTHLAVKASTGFFIITVILLFRLLGMLEPLEIIYFDFLLKIRKPEPQDSRIILVEINSDNLFQEKDSSRLLVADLISLITNIQEYQPTVIGLNILSDLVEESSTSKKELSNFLASYENVIVAEKIIPPFFYPLADTDPTKVGFVDVVIDENDLIARRMLLASPGFQQQDEFKFSFSLLVSKLYLQEQGYTLSNGENDPVAMKFGDIEIPVLLPNTGGYSRIDAGGIQALVNYRNSQKDTSPFRTINLNSFEQLNFSSLDIKDKIVIIGITNPRKRSRLDSPIRSQMHGLHIRAQFVSNIVSAVLDNRPLIRTWKEIYEYLFIIICSTPIFIRQDSLFKLIRTSILLIFILFVLSYGALAFYGYWITAIPLGFIFALNPFFHCLLKYQDNMRRKVIERTFEIIHNGPLQDLSIILKSTRKKEINLLDLERKLEKLSQDIRGIGEELRGESLAYKQSLYLDNSVREVLDLKNDLHELFYQVYEITLERDFPGFKTLKISLRSFEEIPIKTDDFSKKRALCRFLEEAINNVGKHAISPTILAVKGESQDNTYVLTIQDNGVIRSLDNTNQSGQGTKRALKLAKTLNGTFDRRFSLQEGTICELKWKL
ncbi:CHASE2 domain-containing protein [Leptothoe sp. EHU-05/26/07-4]